MKKLAGVVLAAAVTGCASFEALDRYSGLIKGNKVRYETAVDKKKLGNLEIGPSVSYMRIDKPDGTRIFIIDHNTDGQIDGVLIKEHRRFVYDSYDRTTADAHDKEILITAQKLFDDYMLAIKEERTIEQNKRIKQHLEHLRRGSE